MGKIVAVMTSKTTPAAIFSLPLQCEGQQGSEEEITFLSCPMKVLTALYAGVYSVPGIMRKVDEGV